MELEEKENNMLEEKNIEVNNQLENSVELSNNNIEKAQNAFLETTLGKVINTGVDIGLRTILPDVIENQIIDIKDIMINQGFKEGINTAVKSAIDLGKSAMGILTGNFENISQAHTAVKKGGILDTVSNALDTTLKTATKNKVISKDTSNLIKKGKNAILNTVSNRIEDTFMNQVKSTERVGKYISNWNECYKKEDLDGMQREYKKIKTQLKELMPIEQTIQQARKIENIQTLIQNKNGDFNLSEEEIELANKLA